MILGSLIGFNLLAPIRLAPGDEAPIIACGPPRPDRCAGAE